MSKEKLYFASYESKVYLPIHGADVEKVNIDSFKDTFRALSKLEFSTLKTKLVALDVINLDLASKHYEKLRTLSRIMDTTDGYEQIFQFIQKSSLNEDYFLDSIVTSLKDYSDSNLLDEAPYYLFRDFTLSTKMENEGLHEYASDSNSGIHAITIPSISLLNEIVKKIEKHFEILDKAMIFTTNLNDDLSGIMNKVVNPVIENMVHLAIFERYFESLSGMYMDLSENNKAPLDEYYYTFATFFKSMNDLIHTWLENLTNRYNSDMIGKLTNAFIRHIFYGTGYNAYCCVNNIIEDRKYIGDLDRLDDTSLYKNHTHPIIRITAPRKNVESVAKKVIDVRFKDLITIDLEHIYSSLNVITQKVLFPFIECNSIVNFGASISDASNMNKFKLTTEYDDIKFIKAIDVLGKLQYTQSEIEIEVNGDESMLLSMSRYVRVGSHSHIFDFKHASYFFAKNQAVYITIVKDEYIVEN